MCSQVHYLDSLSPHICSPCSLRSGWSKQCGLDADSVCLIADEYTWIGNWQATIVGWQCWTRILRGCNNEATWSPNNCTTWVPPMHTKGAAPTMKVCNVECCMTSSHGPDFSCVYVYCLARHSCIYSALFLYLYIHTVVSPLFCMLGWSCSSNT